MTGQSSSSRRRVQLITEHWDGEADEASAATRLVAGALARSAEVEVVHLLPGSAERSTVTDSVFRVHRVPVEGARPLAAGVLRAALSSHDGGRRVPESLKGLLEDYEGVAAARRRRAHRGREERLGRAGWPPPALQPRRPRHPRRGT